MFKWNVLERALERPCIWCFSLNRNLFEFLPVCISYTKNQTESHASLHCLWPSEHGWDPGVGGGSNICFTICASIPVWLWWTMCMLLRCSQWDGIRWETSPLSPRPRQPLWQRRRWGLNREQWSLKDWWVPQEHVQMEMKENCQLWAISWVQQLYEFNKSVASFVAVYVLYILWWWNVICGMQVCNKLRHKRESLIKTQAAYGFRCHTSVMKSLVGFWNREWKLKWRSDELMQLISVPVWIAKQASQKHIILKERHRRRS